MTSNAATRKSVENGFSVAEHNAATANIENLWKHAELIETRSDSSGDKNIASIKRFLSPVYFGSKEAFAYITAKESVRDGHRIYSIEIEKLESIDGKLKGGFPSTSIDSPNIISKLRSKVNGPETRNLYSKDGSVIGWFDSCHKGDYLPLLHRVLRALRDVVERLCASFPLDVSAASLMLTIVSAFSAIQGGGFRSRSGR